MLRPGIKIKTPNSKRSGNSVGPLFLFSKITENQMNGTIEKDQIPNSQRRSHRRPGPFGI